ncbi:hypothetical protein BMS3Abin06_01876 [bacterium BMS3Abin06]|nr:hypothetical protein BMS3Abin06_01876 [bacterium BMS3Abin06]
MLTEGVQLIMGMDMCIACNPVGIVECVSGKKSEPEKDVSEVEAPV